MFADNSIYGHDNTLLTVGSDHIGVNIFRLCLSIKIDNRLSD